jgi:tetraprenyl-beta-curcumene synthase
MRTLVSLERAALRRAYARAAINYWMDVFPRIQDERRHWRCRAELIPDPVLRSLALNAQRVKQTNVEGSAAFAAFTPPEHLLAVVRAQVAFQSIYDYADTLAEQPNERPVANGRQLHQALSAALDPRASILDDYYANQQRRDDGGYLQEIVRVCNGTLETLPSYDAVAAAAGALGERIVCYQSLNLTEQQGGQGRLARWARLATPRGGDLRWWETAASAGSSLGVFALIAAAARPELASTEAGEIKDAYWPWIGALHSLLDSVVDEAEDAAAGQRSLLDRYSSPNEAAARLAFLARESMRSVRGLTNSHQHSIVVTGMVGSYLSSGSHSQRGRLVSRAVLAEMDGLIRPTMLIFRCREIAKALAEGTTPLRQSLSLQRTPQSAGSR